MRPLVMGVLHVTPDSFSDGGSWADPDAAVHRGRQLLSEGADIIDVGGESTRPGAEPGGIDTGLARVVPTIEALVGDVAAAGARLSVDTRHAEVARAALAAGATILNDVSASLEHVAGEAGAGWVAMHMLGEPGTMQDDPHYDDVVAEVRAFLVAAEQRGRDAGVDEIWIDPGIGFGKTFAHNWALLGALATLVDTGIPVAIGTSRKGFLGAILAEADGTDERPGPEDRLEGSITTACWAATMGAAMIRVHDVRATVAALDAALAAPGPGAA